LGATNSDDKDGGTNNSSSSSSNSNNNNNSNSNTDDHKKLKEGENNDNHKNKKDKKDDGNKPKDNTVVDVNFRLFLTTEPTSDFPISLLQSSMKVTNEPPAGLRAGLLHSYTSFVDQEKLERVDTKEWRSLLFALCFLHSTIMGKEKFLHGCLYLLFTYCLLIGACTYCLLIVYLLFTYCLLIVYLLVLVLIVYLLVLVLIVYLLVLLLIGAFTYWCLYLLVLLLIGAFT
jgi:hypothetical protein